MCEYNSNEKNALCYLDQTFLTMGRGKKDNSIVLCLEIIELYLGTGFARRKKYCSDGAKNGAGLILCRPKETQHKLVIRYVHKHLNFK